MYAALLMTPLVLSAPCPSPYTPSTAAHHLETYCLLANLREQGHSSPSSLAHHVGEPKAQLKVAKSVFKRGRAWHINLVYLQYWYAQPYACQEVPERTVAQPSLVPSAEARQEVCSAGVWPQCAWRYSLLLWAPGVMA